MSRQPHSAADSPIAVRLRAERLVIDAATRGVRSSVIRLAPTVHGAGDKGFVEGAPPGTVLLDVVRRRARQPASSAATRALLGWEPQRPRLLDDMRAHDF
ncbi:MAG TPA: hypothetical protein VGD56_20190 [Gemmatirosa sp.]